MILLLYSLKIVYARRLFRKHKFFHFLKAKNPPPAGIHNHKADTQPNGLYRYILSCQAVLPVERQLRVLFHTFPFGKYLPKEPDANTGFHKCRDAI